MLVQNTNRVVSNLHHVLHSLFSLESCSSRLDTARWHIEDAYQVLLLGSVCGAISWWFLRARESKFAC